MDARHKAGHDEFWDDVAHHTHGFENVPTQAYRSRFPDDPATTDLDRWHTFETSHPATFVGMYQFWVQKAGTAV